MRLHSSRVCVYNVTLSQRIFPVFDRYIFSNMSKQNYLNRYTPAHRQSWWCCLGLLSLILREAQFWYKNIITFSEVLRIAFNLLNKITFVCCNLCFPIFYIYCLILVHFRISGFSPLIAYFICCFLDYFESLSVLRPSGRMAERFPKETDSHHKIGRLLRKPKRSSSTRLCLSRYS